MIQLTKEEAQQVLDALECATPPTFSAKLVEDWHKAVDVLRARLAEKEQEEKKLWLWKNFVDGKPEYWAFDNPYPTNLDNGDPQTLGQPCGYAIFKPSHDGSNGRTEEQVLRKMASINKREWQGLTDEEINKISDEWRETQDGLIALSRAIEAKLKEKNS
jgi:hypothetical protein